MKKITILALHLGYGGIEKCICELANDLVENYKVEIDVVYKLYEEPAFKLDKKVQVRYLTNNIKPNRIDFMYALKKFNIINIIREGIKSLRILYLRRTKTIEAIKNCNADVIISSRIFFNTLVGKYARNKIEKWGWEHNHHHGDKKYIKSLVQSCLNLDKLIVVSNDLKDYYTKLFKEKKLQCEVKYIPNYIDELPKDRSNLDLNKLISVGRLSPEKGFLDLIDVFKIVEMKRTGVSLDIVGDGVEQKAIFKKIVNNNLSGKVKLHGFRSKDYINELYQNAGMYLMTSKTESFGIVLIEAMSYGIPCLAYDSAEGAREIINNDGNGYLIKNRNEHDMADKILSIMNDPKLLNRLSENAIKTAKKYTKDNVIKLWYEMLKR